MIWGAVGALLLLIVVLSGLGFAETVLVQMGVNRLRKLMRGDNGAEEFTPDEQVRLLTTILLMRVFAMLFVGGLVVQLTIQFGVFEHLEPIETVWAEFGLMFTAGLVLAFFDTVARRQARFRAQAWAAVILTFFRRVSGLLSPFVRLLFKVTSPLSPSTTWSTMATLDDLQDEVIHLRSQGVLKETQTEIFTSLLDFGDTIAREVMVPRVDMVCLPLGLSLKEVLALMTEHGFSRIPVYRETIDDIVGFAHVKDMIANIEHLERPLVLEDLREVLVVPGTRKVGEILRDFQAQSRSLAMVFDEYGGTDGLLTVEDILEEIVGEITDEYDDELQEIERLDDGSALVDAKMIVEDVNDHLGIDIPTEGSETLGGYLYELFGHAPQNGESVQVDGVLFAVESVQRKRITRVRIEKMTEGDYGEEKEQVA